MVEARRRKGASHGSSMLDLPDPGQWVNTWPSQETARQASDRSSAPISFWKAHKLLCEPASDVTFGIPWTARGGSALVFTRVSWKADAADGEPETTRQGVRLRYNA